MERLQLLSKLCSVTAFFSQIPSLTLDSSFSSIVPPTTVIRSLSRSNLVDIPYPLSQPKLDAIKALLELGVPCNDIAALQGCSAEIVRHIKHNIIDYGTPKAPKVVA